MFKKRVQTRKKKAKRRRKSRKTQRGGLNFGEFMDLTETFKLPLLLDVASPSLSPKNNEITLSFKNLEDSEETVKNVLKSSPDKELIRDSKYSKTELYDYAITNAIMNSLKEIEQQIQKNCKTFVDAEYLIEVLKNAWDSNLEYAFEHGTTNDARLTELKKRYIKVILRNKCHEIIIINNGVLFPEEKISSKKTMKKDHIKIKNYKLLGGQNIGLSALTSELKKMGYELITENHSNESWVIIKLLENKSRFSR